MNETAVLELRRIHFRWRLFSTRDPSILDVGGFVDDELVEEVKNCGKMSASTYW